MKYPLLLIALLFACTSSLFSQFNVGIGTNTPTNSLHVVVDPLNPNPDPVRFEGLLLYTTETNLLVVDQSTGVVKYMPLNNVLSTLDSNYLDSIILRTVLNNTGTIYSNQQVIDSILSITLRSSDTLIKLIKETFNVKQLILDSSYSVISDSLLKDISWLTALSDTIQSTVDSVVTNGTQLIIYENGNSFSTNLLQLLGNSVFTDSAYAIISERLTKDKNWISIIKDSVDSDIDSVVINGTQLVIYEDGKSVSVDAMKFLGNSNYQDSIYQIVKSRLVTDKNYQDQRYASISDSLSKDNIWLNTVKNKIDSDVDSIRIIGSNLVVFEDGNSVSTNLLALLGSKTYSDSIFSIIRDSLLLDSKFIDGRYLQISDSLLNDISWLNELEDSIHSDIDSVKMNGTVLSIYEKGKTSSVDLVGLTVNPIFLQKLKDSIDTHLDSANLTGNSTLNLYVDGKPITVDIKPLTDSAEWTDQGSYIEARRAGEDGNAVIVTDKGNVGIGITALDPSAALQIYSSNQGFLPPSMSTAERIAIASPSPGLQVYDTDENCIFMYNGSNWRSLCAKIYKKDDAFVRRVLKGDTLEMTQTFTLTSEQVINVIASLNSYPWVNTSGARVEGMYDIVIDGIVVTNGMRLANVNQGTNFLKFSNVATWSQILYPGTHTITFRISCTDSPGAVDLTAEDRRMIITLH